MRFADTDEGISQLYIALEHMLLSETSGFVASMFQLIAVHYVFNVQYHPQVNDVLVCLQEKMLGVVDGAKKTMIHTYLSVTSAIECFL